MLMVRKPYVVVIIYTWSQAIVFLLVVITGCLRTS